MREVSFTGAACKTPIDSERRKSTQASPDFSNPGTRLRLSLGFLRLVWGRSGLRSGGRFEASFSARALAGGLSGAVPLLLLGWVRLSRLRCGGG